MKYVTLGVCSKEINFDVVENKIKKDYYKIIYNNPNC